MSGSDAVLNNYLIVGALLFTLGLVGFLARRNLIVMFLCAELMLQGVSLTLVAFSAFHNVWSGQAFAIMSLALAAAEAGVALALFVVLFRRGHSLDVSIWQDLREADQPPVADESVADESAADEKPGAKPAEHEWPHLPVAGQLPRESDGRGNRAAKAPSANEPVAAGAVASRGVAHD